MYVTGSYANYVYHFVKEIVLQLICTFSYVTYEHCIETDECSFTHGLQEYNLVNHILMLCKSLRSFSFI